MASRGSVIPLFVNQLKSGEQLTVTEPEMTRFLMSLEDSVDLVLHAFEHAEPGDIFVQKAPASTVQVLADALLALFKSDAGSRVIGTRHGEKLYESLISREEMAKAIDMGRYYRVPADIRDLNYNKFFSEGETKIAQFEDYTSHNAERLDVEDTVQLLKKLSYIQEQLNA
jgi:UDP-glucose 4-epimerase